MSCLVYSLTIKISHSSLKLLRGPLRFSGHTVFGEPCKQQAEGCGGVRPCLVLTGILSYTSLLGVEGYPSSLAPETLQDELRRAASGSEFKEPALFL